MGNLSRKLFKKTKSVTQEKAVKIGIEVYKKKRDEEGSILYAELLACLLACLHNDFGFGRQRLAKALYQVNDLMIGLKNYDGNPVEEARRILKDECKFNIVEEYQKIMNKQGATSQ